MPRTEKWMLAIAIVAVTSTISPRSSACSRFIRIPALAELAFDDERVVALTLVPASEVLTHGALVLGLGAGVPIRLRDSAGVGGRLQASAGVGELSVRGAVDLFPETSSASRTVVEGSIAAQLSF